MKLLDGMRFLPYRIVRRLGTADISRVFGIETNSLRSPAASEGFCFLEVTQADICKLVTTHPDFFDDTQACQLADEGVYCFAVFRGPDLAAFAWLATGDICGEFNHNGDLRAGLPVSLPSDTGFVYNVFVVPAYRGKRLYATVMSYLAKVMQPRGVTRLILTTDATNTSSINALHRMGFQQLGKAWLFRLGPFSMAGYPPSPIFGAVRFGTYTGDRRTVPKQC